MITDESIFYRHKPDITRKYSRANVRFNRYGLRDGEISKDKENAIRLLLLGDSVTFGWGVNQEEIFPEVLEKNSFKFSRELLLICTSPVDQEQRIRFLE